MKEKVGQKQVSPKVIALVFGILVVSLVAAFYAIAWNSPTELPPEGNVPAPINVGTEPQGKAGRLSVTELYDFNDSSYYLNPDNVSTLKALDMAGGGGSYLKLPHLTTVQRDALSPEAGMMVYNTTMGEAQIYIPDQWLKFPATGAPEGCKPSGTGCSSPSECCSGFCSPDGYCCDSECSGAPDCSSCATGTCTSINEGGECWSGGWSGCQGCSYSSTCDESASGTKTRDYKLCSGGTCSESHTESQSCTCTRDTDGDRCGTCKECSGGSCVNVAEGSDPFNDCYNSTGGEDCSTAQARYGTCHGCSKGYCDGSGSCAYYTSGEHECPTCYTCDGATSQHCEVFDTGETDTQGSETCVGGHKACRAITRYRYPEADCVWPTYRQWTSCHNVTDGGFSKDDECKNWCTSEVCDASNYDGTWEVRVKKESDSAVAPFVGCSEPGIWVDPWMPLSAPDPTGAKCECSCYYQP